VSVSEQSGNANNIHGRGGVSDSRNPSLLQWGPWDLARLASIVEKSDGELPNGYILGEQWPSAPKGGNPPGRKSPGRDSGRTPSPSMHRLQVLPQMPIGHDADSGGDQLQLGACRYRRINVTSSKQHVRAAQ
jgi:hypothetical protein